MKKLYIILFFILISFSTKATIHEIKVWTGYMQFMPYMVTVQLGDTIQWVPLDPPSVAHTVTSVNIPAGAATFDYLWQLPTDTFFQYIPQHTGLYEYECTPHVQWGMTGSFTVQGVSSVQEVASTNSSFTVYPNPASNIIKYNSSIREQFFIYDMKGSIGLTGNASGEVDISSLKAGPYVLEMAGDRPRTIKFIKN